MQKRQATKGEICDYHEALCTFGGDTTSLTVWYHEMYVCFFKNGYRLIPWKCVKHQPSLQSSTFSKNVALLSQVRKNSYIHPFFWGGGLMDMPRVIQMQNNVSKTGSKLGSLISEVILPSMSAQSSVLEISPTLLLTSCHLTEDNPHLNKHDAIWRWFPWVICKDWNIEKISSEASTIIL